MSEYIVSLSLGFIHASLNGIGKNVNDSETIYSDTNKFYIYGVIARLAILAASKELYNIEP